MGFPRQVYWSGLPCPSAGLEVGSRLEWTPEGLLLPVCGYFRGYILPPCPPQAIPLGTMTQVEGMLLSPPTTIIIVTFFFFKATSRDD